MALAAVADDQDLLALDQVHVGITIVIDTHLFLLPLEWRAVYRADGARRKPRSTLSQTRCSDNFTAARRRATWRRCRFGRHRPGPAIPSDRRRSGPCRRCR